MSTINNPFDTNPVIQRLRDERAAEVTYYAAMALRLWQQFTKNERTLVRFGMFPADRMAEAERAVNAERKAAGGPAFDVQQLAVALMECANKDGGMRA